MATQHAVPFLRAFGHVVLGWIWLDLLLAVARAVGEAPSPHASLMLAGRYFLGHELPPVHAWLTPIVRQDRLWLEAASDAL